MEVKVHPAVDVVAAPPDSDPAKRPEPPKAEAAKPHHEDKKPAKPAPAPKQRDGSVTAAIFATVVIVLGLAAMAVFAYLKQTGSI